MPLKNTKTDATLARYLLGKLSPEQVSRIDAKLLADESYMERLTRTDYALICDFVCGGLTDEDRELLERQFLRCGEKARQLEIAQFLYWKIHQPAALDSADPAFEYLLGDSSSERWPELEERALGDEDFKTRLNYAEYEVILSYLRQGLSSSERERFEQYFLCAGSPDHAERIAKLRFVEVFCVYARRHGIGEFLHQGRFHRLRQWLSEPISFSRPAWQPLIAVLVIGLCAPIWPMFIYEPPITQGLNTLKAAYALERPIEARIIGFDYAPYPMGQSDGAVKFDRQKRDQAFNIIIGLADEKDIPTVYHAIGKLYLTERRLDDAVQSFELALKDNDRNAMLHNDLAVALMEREKAKGPGRSAGDDFADAVEHLHRAIELDGSLLEAHFNLALCHQYQRLWRTAKEDWKRYLEKDSQSPWAEEARKNLEKVSEKIKQVAEDRENIHRDFLDAYRRGDGEQAWRTYKRGWLATGNFITERLIDNYLSLALSGRSAEAGASLSALQFIGEIELEKVEDRFTYDLARFYRGASPQQLRKISAARSLASTANERLGQSRLDEAINNYRRAIEMFDQAGDVCESLTARRRLGYCYFQRASPALSSPVIMQGRRECEARNYLWLLTMFLNDLVNINTDLGRYSAALDAALSQVSYAKRIGDDSGIVRGINRLTETYVLLAMRQETLQMVQEGLSVASAINADPRQLIVLYWSASKSYMASGKFMTALDYQKEAFKLSLEINNPWLVSRHHVHLGLAYHKLNNHAEAIRLIRQGIEIGARLPDRKMGREIMTFSHLNMGEVYREMGDLDNAVKSYGDALRLCDENAIDIQWLRFWAKKGILQTRINRAPAAEEELKQVIDLYEQHRQNIKDENSRNNFFDNEQGIYDIAIEYAYFKRQDPRRAFDFSEMSRARSLLDAIVLPPGKLPEENPPSIRLPHSTRPLDLAQIQRRLPGKTQLLQYSVLDKRLIIWAVSGAVFKSHSVEVGREELDGKVSDYLRSLAGGPNAGDHRARSSELYSLLIKPVENLLDKDAEICIIPDKVLNRLPFASLVSPATGKYLIEERVIFTSPSSNIFLIASDKARQKEGVQTERLLSVGNPWFDRAAFRNLKDLPWTATQASAISAFYRSPTVLLEKNAREASVRTEIEKSDVAHFATHYVPDERSPMLSVLPLAEEASHAPKESDGMLKTYEFYGMKLSRLRLVVLSGCQTGIERYYNGEGAIGLARAFQAAGIPLVVASLWPVESYPTKELMISFHRHRKSGGLSTAQALRQAQLDMIRSGSPELRNPHHWAVYTVIGGHTTF